MRFEGFQHRRKLEHQRDSSQGYRPDKPWPLDSTRQVEGDLGGIQRTQGQGRSVVSLRPRGHWSFEKIAWKEDRADGEGFWS
jgi:hypothetical protein